MHLKKLIWTAITILVVSWPAGFLLKKRIKNMFPVEYAKLDECIDSSRAYDAVFFGDSRFLMGLNTPYFDSLTGMNAFNFGIAGSQLDEMRFISDLYMENHLSPRIAFIGLDEGLVYNGDYRVIYRPNYFLYAHNKSVAKKLSQNGFPGQLIHWVPFTALSFMNDHTRTAVFRPKGENLANSIHAIKGFRNTYRFERTGSLNELIIRPRLDSIPYLPASAMFNELELMIDGFQQRGSHVFVVITPVHSSLKRNEQQLRQISLFLEKKSGVEIIDLHDTTRFPDRYYGDKLHLNTPGSRVLTKAIADRIQIKP
jgi:hypothetical protein